MLRMLGGALLVLGLCGCVHMIYGYDEEVAGTVVDAETGEGIEGVQVSLRDGEHVSALVETGAGGAFTAPVQYLYCESKLFGVGRGKFLHKRLQEFTFVFEKPGYRTHELVWPARESEAETPKVVELGQVQLKPVE